MALFFVERFNGRGWRSEGSFPNRGEALQDIERLRRIYGHATHFRIVAR